jgi:hypothetical protein
LVRATASFCHAGLSGSPNAAALTRPPHVVGVQIQTQANPVWSVANPRAILPKGHGKKYRIEPMSPRKSRTPPKQVNKFKLRLKILNQITDINVIEAFRKSLTIFNEMDI